MGLNDQKTELLKTAVWLYFLGFYENPAHPEKGSITLSKELDTVKLGMSMEALLLQHTFAKKQPPARAAEMVFRDANEHGDSTAKAPLAQGLTRPDGGNMELAGRLHYAGSSLQT